MESIHNKAVRRADFENLVQASLLTGAALPDTGNAEEETWLNDCLSRTATQFADIVKRIENCNAKGSKIGNSEVCRLTEDLIAKISWLEHRLPEPLDQEEKMLLDRLTIRDSRILDGEKWDADEKALQETLHEMQRAVSWGDFSITDLHIMKARGVISNPQYHYYLSRIAYAEEFA